MNISNRKRVLAVLAPAAVMLRHRASAQDGIGGATPPGMVWPTQAWPAGSPGEHGFPPDLSAQIDARVAAETPLVTSLLVVSDGNLVVDNYYNGFTFDQPFHVWSITKSVTSIATGIAFREALLTDFNQTLGELIPDRIPANADPRVWDITLYHLLTSTSGWAWDGRINFSRHGETDDLDAMLARPMAFSPGEGFEYDSTNSNLLSYIIQVQSGVPMAQYLQPRLFDPLGIPAPEWTAMYQGRRVGRAGCI